jgi:two-component system phosphate regulon sensor histidine kinase PhoR
MKKRSIGLIIGLMGFALLGVMAMQWYFLRQSYQLQSKLFDHSVNEALDNVVTKTALQDANNFLHRKANLNLQRQFSVTTRTGRSVADSIAHDKASKAHLQKIALLKDSLSRLLQRKKQEDEVDKAIKSGRYLSFKYEEFVDENGILIQRIAPPEIVQAPAESKKPLQKYDVRTYEYYDPVLGRQQLPVRQINPEWQREQLRRLKARQLKQIRNLLAADSIAQLESKRPAVAQATVFQTLAEEYQKAGEPLRQRVDTTWIDSLLRVELRNRGIDIPYNYEVSNANNDSLIFSNASNKTLDTPRLIAENTYEMPIFGKELVNDPGRVRLYFPDKDAHIRGMMTYTISISGGLLAILLLCFGYTIFSILKQKKISEMKTDFINNMTHEFKTPVSTIMIASEALKDPEVATNSTRVGRLADIIYEENNRLGSHIERVLNIARIEKNDFKLDITTVDINELITDVLDSMALKLQKHDTRLKLHLDAADALIKADELHFSNVIYNLIDNAIKYSAGQPQITITTLNKNDQLIIRVADKGIGMSRDQQTKIFEQFYRVPTGNLHDVKGFGLGLSYVNTIVNRLDGTIGVKSEKDKGSEFELKFKTA